MKEFYAEPDRADMLVRSAESVRVIDEIRYSLGEGPCVSAAAFGETMRSGSLGVVTTPRPGAGSE